MINVLPTVSFEPSGNFLIADLKEAEVRRYLPSGKLLASFGSEGGGPAEFRRLATAVWNGGSILAADMDGKLVTFDSGGAYVTSVASGLSPIYDAALLNDSVIAFAARQNDTRYLVHLWNVPRAAVVRSFFEVPDHPERYELAYMSTGTVDVATRGDTTAVTFSLADTVYVFGPAGTVLERIPIPFKGFQPLREAPPQPRTPESMREWISSFSRISQIFWAPDGTFYVQYFDMAGAEPKWRLLHMSRDGRALFEARDNPRLIAINSAGELIFQSPRSMMPNQWYVARTSH